MGLSRGTHSAWGSSTGYSPGTPMAWNGRAGIYTDAETSLMLMGARYYSPSIGRFISRDPSGFESGPNPYSYCAGDPIDFLDPSGLITMAQAGAWYSNGMGGFSDWADDNLMNGSTANFGKVSGEYDSGKASAWDVVKAGAWWGGNLGMAAIQIADGAALARDLGKVGLGIAAKGAAKFAAKRTPETVDLYRAVGTREFESIMTNKAFLPGGNSLEARQFAMTLDEALAYADVDASKVAIIKATIQTDALSAFDFSKSIDPFIFKNGVVTVQPGTQSEIFHSALLSIEHVF